LCRFYLCSEFKISLHCEIIQSRSFWSLFWQNKSRFKNTKCLAGSSWVGQCLLFKGLIKMLMGVPRLAKNTFIVACCCCFSFCSHICCLLYIVHAHVVTLLKFQSAHLAVSIKCMTGYSKSDWFLAQFYERSQVTIFCQLFCQFIKKRLKVLLKLIVIKRFALYP
jgi:hypothetical protein